MSFFHNIINYTCYFFFNIKSFKSIINFINLKNLNISFFVDLVVFNNIFKYKLLNSFFNRNIFNYYLSDIFSIILK